jgi:chitinase
MTPEERAHAAAVGEFQQASEPRRRLSWFRVFAAFVVLAVVGTGIVGFRRVANRPAPPVLTSSFAPYVDVTATPTFAFEDPAQSSSTSLTLGFIVSDPHAACQPSWGAAYSMSQAATSMDLDRRIARLRERGGEVAVSFGGEANSELSVGCADVGQLEAAYRSVVDRYSVHTIDLDVEGSASSAPDVVKRRAAAIAKLQSAERAAGRSLAVWLTLPVSPDGLTAEGANVVSSMLAARVTLAGVNAMTMDYGQAKAAGESMDAASEAALLAVHQQLKVAYAHAGQVLDDDAVWQHIGATPMIGQNDVVGERFELSDASALLVFAQRHHLRRLSMWSVNRDQSCGPNYANVEVVSPNCSGISQHPAEFTKIFAGVDSATSVKGTAKSAGVATGHATPSAGPASGSSLAPSVRNEVDDPATSPYQIWNPDQAYPKDTKVVWHHNVYQAKWYTQGDTPDAPVDSASATPWTLIGPVLPGEHPVVMPTLSAGVYPAWDPTVAYVGGQRVLYDGYGYQAKWWTQGDVPGGPSQSSAGNPWELLTSG